MKKLLLLIITMQITLFAQTPTPYIPINSGDVVEDHVNYLEKKYYQLELSNTQTADIQLTDLDADIDLYVAINRKASIRDNDCYSSNGGTTYEKCVLSSTAPEGKKNNIIILVYGFKTSNYKLKISTREGGESITEISDNPLSDHLKRGESAQYKFLGKKGKTYTTTLSNLSADADLRVKIGKKANLHSFDCKSTNGGTKTDECSVTLTKDATVFVHVNGYRTADYSIKVSQKPIINKKKIIKIAKEHCLNKNNSTNEILCSNEKDTVYILKNDINYESAIAYHALYKVIITSGNESVTLLRERSKPTWQQPHTNEYFIKKLEDTLMYGTYTISDEADERGNFNFHYKEKTLLSFGYIERDGYLRKKYTSEDGNRLHIEYNDRIYSDYGRKCSEVYNISNPAEPKLINKECTPLYQ